MKTILFASAMMISGMAYAQATQPTEPTEPSTTAQPGTPPAENNTMTPDQTQQPAPTMTQPEAASPPDATMPPPPPATEAPGAPTGTTGTTGSGTMTVQQGGNMSPPPTDTGPYPKCSRTVTDHCVQNQSRERDTKATHRRPRR